MRNDENMFYISEIFKSIEGEGIRTGLPVVFVRFGGCNLSCSYCDTGYAQTVKDSKLMSRKQILLDILSHNCNRVTFTGGEPLFAGKDFIKWFLEKHLHGMEVNIETNGSILIPNWLNDQYRVIITMDYKCFSSGMSHKMVVENLKKLKTKDVLKFVVGDDKDLEQVVKLVIEHEPQCNIYLSPVFGKMDLQKLAEFVVKHDKLNLRLGLQIHKFVWDPNMRGV